MESRPRVKPEATLTNRFIDALIMVLIFATWVYGITQTPKAQNSKAGLYLIPVVATVISVLLIILNRFPHVFNYPVRVTEQNALRLYTLASRMLRVTNLSMVLMFLLIQIAVTYKEVHQLAVPSLLVITTIGASIFILAAVIYFIIKMNGAK